MSFMDTELKKIKSASKIIVPSSFELEKIIIETVDLIAEMVGSTLGPHGKTILIERADPGLAPYQTKDGVTVARSLGFRNSVQQVILEAFRDAAVKTVESAGDGPQPLWSKILTPSGFISMKDVQVGMKICGTNGTVQRVLGVFPKGQKEIIKITFEDNSIVECCADHLWSVTTNYGSKKVIKTEEIINDFVEITNNNQKKFKYYIEKSYPEFAENEFSIDPYLLGVLLGDGSLGESGSIEIWLGKSKQHIINKLKFPKGIQTNISYIDNKNSFRIKITGVNNEGKSIRDLLDELGLKNTKSKTKFIPKRYLFSSKDNREQLLQGLMNTDGFFNKRSLFEFSTVSDFLKNDISDLMKSLGKSIYSKIHHRDRDSGSYSENPIHRIYELKGNKYGNKIISVEKTGQFTEMQCIKVSNENSLYITDGFIATHNTTTATVLAQAIMKNMSQFLKDNKQYSPQQAVREITAFFETVCVPYIESKAIKVNKDNYNELLLMVAKVSTNGDDVLSQTVLEAFNLVGDRGHITLAEEGGSHGFGVSKVSGYVVNKGFEESCGRFSNEFIDQSNSKIILENPSFILVDGNVMDMAGLGRLFQLLEQEYIQNNKTSTNFVIMAHQFNNSVVAQLAKIQSSSTFKIIPCLTPVDALANSRYDFLRDMAAFTGGKIFNSVNYPLSQGVPSDLGQTGTSFEMARFVSVVHGAGNEATILQRVAQLQIRRDSATTSKFEKSILDERIGRLTGGIAKLTIRDVSDSQVRETKDRAEDAICALRGAPRTGVLPGGGRILLNLSLKAMEFDSLVVKKVLGPAFTQPLLILLENSGLSDSERRSILDHLVRNEYEVYNALTKQLGDPFELKLLDSVPAVMEAVRSAISISSLLGTLGGICVFQRDDEYERQQSGKSVRLQSEMDGYTPDNSFMLEES